MQILVTFCYFCALFNFALRTPLWTPETEIDKDLYSLRLFTKCLHPSYANLFHCLHGFVINLKQIIINLKFSLFL